MHYLLCEIHVHIQLAAAYQALGKMLEAKEELQLAFSLALLISQNERKI